MTTPKQIFLSLLAFLCIAGCRKSDYTLEDDAVTITDNGGGTGTVTWTHDREYLLEGFVFVNDGQVLTIEPGTVIRAKAGQGSAASALIVARGGRIIANGTQDDPIIFTANGDDLSGSVPLKTKGLWGGVIILGNAPLNLSQNEAHIEGIPLYETRGEYGGTNDEDHSGILRYVSIRHSGTNIGEGNEINGLTLGGVGSQTVIDHVEVVSNADDGFEFFGGSVCCRYLVAAFCDDDAFDFDLGYRGKGQFWFAVQEVSGGDRLIEVGGGMDPVTGTPHTMPRIFNATLIGGGNGDQRSLMYFSRNGAGEYANSIFLNKGQGVYLEYIENADDSYGQFLAGNLGIPHNVFYAVGDGTPEGIFTVYASPGTNVDAQNAVFQEYFTGAGNRVLDPGIEYSDDFCDPLPSGGAVLGGLEEYPSDWFVPVPFKGAFYTYNWAAGWTLLSSSGYLRN
ncbi:MAG: hypothetical protein R6T99_05130 [Bacteroidales bacterium]